MVKLDIPESGMRKMEALKHGLLILGMEVPIFCQYHLNIIPGG